MAIFACFGPAGCKGPLEKRAAEISELRDVVMKASSEAASVVLIGGYREEPFAIDGVSGGKRDFVVLTLTPGSASGGATSGTSPGADTAFGTDTDSDWEYVLLLGDERFEGKFSRHPFRNSFSFELEARVDPARPVALTVTAGGYVETFEPKSVIAEDALSAADALEIAEHRLKKRVAAMKADGRLAAEIFVRFTDNPISSDGGYYWYVAFAAAENDIAAVLIDPVSGNIAAIRE